MDERAFESSSRDDKKFGVGCYEKTRNCKYTVGDAGSGGVNKLVARFGCFFFRIFLTAN